MKDLEGTLNGSIVTSLKNGHYTEEMLIKELEQFCCLEKCQVKSLLRGFKTILKRELKEGNVISIEGIGELNVRLRRKILDAKSNVLDEQCVLKLKPTNTLKYELIDKLSYAQH